MRTLAAVSIAALVCVTLAGAATAGEAGPDAKRALQAACFAPAVLAAMPGEQVAAKGDHRFSKPPPRTTVLAADPIAPPLRGSIRRVELPKGKKLIALTFDLCEDRGEVAGYEGRIIDILRRENVKATLFAGGKWMRSHLARTEQLMTDPLFEIANHSEAHRNLRLLDGANLNDEILGAQRAYETIRQGLGANQCTSTVPEGLQSVAPRLSLFRFPFGACNPQAMKAVNDAGLLAIQWDVSTGDPAPSQGAAAIARAMTRNVRPGSILIAHANGRGWHTADALPIAIPALKAQGYEFVTVSELLAAGTPVIAETCYDSRPGDTDRYDVLHALAARQKTLAGQSSGQSSAFDLPWFQGTIVTKEPRRPAAKRAPKSDSRHEPKSKSILPD